jgi:hypothetical protein
MGAHVVLFAGMIPLTTGNPKEPSDGSLGFPVGEGEYPPRQFLKRHSDLKRGIIFLFQYSRDLFRSTFEWIFQRSSIPYC